MEADDAIVITRTAYRWDPDCRTIADHFITRDGYDHGQVMEIRLKEDVVEYDLMVKGKRVTKVHPRG